MQGRSQEDELSGALRCIPMQALQECSWAEGPWVCGPRGEAEFVRGEGVRALAQQEQDPSQENHCPRVGCWDLELAGSPGGSHSWTSTCRGEWGQRLSGPAASLNLDQRWRNPASQTAQSPSGMVRRIPVHTARTSVRKPRSRSFSSPGSRSHPALLCHSSSFLCPPHLPFLPPKLNSTSGPALPKPPPQSLWVSWAQRFISAPFRYCRRLSTSLTRPKGRPGPLRHS